MEKKAKDYDNIRIVSNGRQTVAEVTYEDMVHTGMARCSARDPYVPEIGAIIALCKAMSVDVVDTCRAVIKAMFAMRTVGTKTTRVRVDTKTVVREARGKALGKIRTGRVRLQPSGALKKLAKDMRSLGTVGRSTRFVDVSGKPLYVGDLVTVDRRTGTVRQGRKWEAVPGLHFVVCEDSDDPDSKGAYIMGMMNACNPRTGKIDANFRIRLAKTWRAVELGEVHDMVEPIWEGETDA